MEIPNPQGQRSVLELFERNRPSAPVVTARDVRRLWLQDGFVVAEVVPGDKPSAQYTQGFWLGAVLTWKWS
jgi:hypothetical protein